MVPHLALGYGHDAGPQGAEGRPDQGVPGHQGAGAEHHEDQHDRDDTAVATRGTAGGRGQGQRAGRAQGATG